MNRQARILAVAGVLVACGSAFAAGMWAGVRRAQSSSEWVDGRLISTAIDSVRANALDSLPSDELIKRAVSGMLHELHDPYAAMLQPDGFAQYRGSLQGDGRGLGLMMRRQAGSVTVSRVLDGSPAWTHGIRAGDRILSVNGIPAEQAWLRRDSVSQRSDTTRFTLQRAPSTDTMSIAILHKSWHAPAVSDAALITDDVAYVHLSTVSARSAAEVEDAVDSLIDAGAKSLILDLRGNGGGLFEEGVRLASLFLPKGVVVASVMGREGVDPQVHEARGTRWPDLPMTVLVDAHTASAAEIVAAALRDHQRALIVGTRSFGKSQVQRVVRLSPAIALRLTTARWTTPHGEVLQRREGDGGSARGGIAPDIRIDDAGAPDLFGLPSEWAPSTASMVTRMSDSAVVVALHEHWQVEPIAMFEWRLRSLMTELVPANRSEGQRSAQIGAATRLATARVLELSNEPAQLLRYRSRFDEPLRAALEVLAPGAPILQVIPSSVKQPTKRVILARVAAPSINRIPAVDR